MKIEDQVCSLELAKRLKELGVKQESCFWWNGVANELQAHVAGTCVGVSAFTVAELGEMLPSISPISSIRNINYFKQGEWTCFYGKSGKGEYFCDNKEADARAKMLIHLIEKGIVKPEQGR